MSIVQNRKAFHDYFVEERYEAGLVLEGWEVKAVRAGRAQISDAYVIVDGGALWLIGAHISPLGSASTHVTPDPTRTRKLLMRAEEIRRRCCARRARSKPSRFEWKTSAPGSCWWRRKPTGDSPRR